MPAFARLGLGAPGIYPYPETPTRTLTGVRLDLCAFAGVAPRGPARVPVVEEEIGGHFWRGDVPCVEPERPRLRTVAVPVESFDEYRRLFGGFEGPGRLPYAVAAYFENGGRRALVARIVHDYGADDKANREGVARGLIKKVVPEIGLSARNEGSWGLGLRAALRFTVRPLNLIQEAAGLAEGAPAGLRIGPGVRLDARALLRVAWPDGTRALRFVERLVRVPDGNRPAGVTLALPETPLPPGAVRFELVEAELTLDDGDGRVERHVGLGLAFGHPRWLAQILCDASELVWPEPDWAQGQVLPLDAGLPDPPVASFGPAKSDDPDTLEPDREDSDKPEQIKDRWADIVPEDFFGRTWQPGSGEPGSGICCFARHRDAEGTGTLRPASLVVPDLYSHAPLAEYHPVLTPASLAGPRFARCVRAVTAETQTRPKGSLDGLYLDPVADLDEIVTLQTRAIAFAESVGDLVALLDVPPGLDPARIRRWRGALGSSFAAAYHPWLRVAPRDEGRDIPGRSPEDLPPSAVAAGVLAERELAAGVPQGPANRLAAGVVDVLAALPPDLHGELHQSGIDCFVRERDGIRLTGARTLSADPAYRQLSVRRLTILLRRVLLAQMQWAVFEPNGPDLWREIRRLLTSYLRELYRHGAFRGASEEEAFFVRCDETLNPSWVQDQGRLCAEVGFAPAEPLEFIVLRIARGGDGTLNVDERRRD